MHPCQCQVETRLYWDWRITTVDRRRSYDGHGKNGTTVAKALRGRTLAYWISQLVYNSNPQHVCTPFYSLVEREWQWWDASPSQGFSRSSGLFGNQDLVGIRNPRSLYTSCAPSIATRGRMFSWRWFTESDDYCRDAHHQLDQQPDKGPLPNNKPLTDHNQKGENETLKTTSKGQRSKEYAELLKTSMEMDRLG